MWLKSIQKCAESILRTIDMYGSKVEITFQKKNKYNTSFGGILTLIIYILFGFGFWFFGRKLIVKENPTVINQFRSVTQPKRIDINKDNLVIMIGLANAQSQPFLDNTIFQVKSFQEELVFYNDTITGQKLRKLTQKPKQIKICDQSDFGIPEITSYFLQAELPKFYCFSNQELYMEGDFDADAFSQVYFVVEKCKNSTDSKIVCKSPEVIDKVLKQTKIQIYFSDKIVDPNNYDHPFSNRGRKEYSPTSSTFPKELHFFFTNYYIESDIGILNPIIDHQKDFIFTEMRELAYFSDPNVLVRMLFRLQKFKENLMQRRYQKLVDVIALIGGLLKILVSLGAIISYPFSKLYLNKAIIDEIFNFNFKPKSQQQIGQADNKSITLRNREESLQTREDNTVYQQRKKNKSTFGLNENVQNTNRNKPEINTFQDINITKSQKYNKSASPKKKQQQDIRIENSSTNSYKRRSILDVVKSLFTITKNTIKFKFRDIFVHIYFKKFKQSDKKHELIEKGISKIVNYFDFLFILNKIHEIDKLKTIILSDDQLKLFDFIPKPIITTDEDEYQNKKQIYEDNTTNPINGLGPINVKNVYSVFNEIKSEEEKALEAYEGLANILKKGKRNKIDEKLVEMIDPFILFQILKKEERQLFNNQTNTQNNLLNNTQLNNTIVLDNMNQMSFFQNEDNRTQELEKEEYSHIKQFKINQVLLKRLSFQNLNQQKDNESIGQVQITSPQPFYENQKDLIKLNQTTDYQPDKKSIEIQNDESDYDTHSVYLAQFSEKSDNNIPTSAISQAKNTFQTKKQMKANEKSETSIQEIKNINN